MSFVCLFTYQSQSWPVRMPGHHLNNIVLRIRTGVVFYSYRQRISKVSYEITISIILVHRCITVPLRVTICRTLYLWAKTQLGPEKFYTFTCNAKCVSQWIHNSFGATLYRVLWFESVVRSRHANPYVMGSSPNQVTPVHTVLMFSNSPINIPFYFSKPFQTQGDMISSSLLFFRWHNTREIKFVT